jgi:methylated-DNA-[protein]-cysteine S-methyltransferase
MPISNAPPEALTLDRLATPIGTALLVTDEHGRLRAFNWTDYEPAMLAWIGKHYRKATIEEGKAPLAVRGAFEAYFSGEARALEGVSWTASGTPFQLKVWETLCSIPAGETLSYAQLAERIGRPTAVRAVGHANGANPVAVVVPCHRVIGTGGSLTGYGGGLQRKRWLLGLEGARFKDQIAA